MGMTGLYLGLGAVPSVSPQMIASTTVLQCGTRELAEYLEEMSYENPLMELEEPEQPQPIQVLAEKLQWLRGSDRQNRSYYSDPDRSSLDQYLAEDRQERLVDFLREQILTLPISPETRRAMETAAELLDGRGLFTGDVQEIARLAECPLEIAQDALERLRSLEPAGVAAPSVQQALLKQLEGMEKPVAVRLVREHFSHLAAWSDQRLARAMGISEEAVAAGRRTIATLDPHPGNGFATQEQIQYVTPDLRIIQENGALRVERVEGGLPQVRISGAYLRLLKTQQDPEVQRYLKEKLRQLEQVMEDLDRRSSTILRCGQVILARQGAFFRGGALKKLTLRDVAEELSLHESTISRAVKHKYVECSRGTLPMSAFFSRDVGQNVGLSRSGVQEVLRAIVDEEDPQKPMSDEKLAAALSARHIVLSRRAVAKYRMELGIPPASGRRRSS